MERVHQMNVVPDLYPSVHPTVDLRVSFKDSDPPPRSEAELRSEASGKILKTKGPSPQDLERLKAHGALGDVVPGVFLSPTQVSF